MTEDSRNAFEELSGDLKAGRLPAKTQDRPLTPAFVAEVRSGTSRSALLYAHDVAGERFQQADSVRDMSALLRTRGALILIDPFSLRAVSSTLDGRDEQRALIDPSAEDPQSVVERFLQAMRETGRSDIRKLPVAVVVSKVDALDAGDGILPGDEGEKVAAWLETHGGGNLVRLLAAEFGSCRFFAVSALGRVPNPSDSSAFSPKGTLEPLFWLLSANKISMNGKATETAATVTDELSAKDRVKRVAPWPRTPLLAPRPRSAGGYAAGVAVALAIFAGVVALAVALSKNTTAEASAYANTGSTGQGTPASSTGSTGNTGSTASATSNTGSTGSTGNTGSTTSTTSTTDNTGTTGNTGSAMSYNGQAFSINYPRGWNIQTAEVPQSWGGTDTTIVSPSDAHTLVRIDVKSSGGGTTPAAAAQPVIASVSSDPGYQQLERRSETIDGYPALAWQFEVTTGGTIVEEEDDFIVASNGANVAVLTQAPVSNYQGRAAQFDAVRSSLSIN